MTEPPTSPSPIAESVKLVVWDLDDTFWRGTLSEEAISPIETNIGLVKRLAERGIISSICSKNDPAAVESVLRDMNIWDFFVLPSVGFQPKGSAIADLAEALHLRPANVLFIDDNPAVLAEAAFACPGLSCLNSPEQLASLMDHPHLQGAADPHLSRLAQYRALAQRHDSRARADLDPGDFLRQSGIRIEIDYDVEPHLDRVIELINRSNQLNYTKRRLESEEDLGRFHAYLKAYGFNAGIVRLSDRYADYGIVGFFMTLATLREYRLEHFSFSCRIMNMGVEQYVYDLLNRPEIHVAEPVANPIVSHSRVDWISEGPLHRVVDRLRDFKLVLIGGCDMLQLSTYCSMDSAEFTNRDVHGIIKRLDDPFLILDDAERVRASPIRARVPAFDADDMIALRTAAGEADAIVLSFYRMMEINYFRGSDGLTVRFDEDAVRVILASDQGLWFVRNFSFREFSHEEKYGLIRDAAKGIADMARRDARIIFLLENIRKLENNPGEFHLRGLYNAFVKSVCAEVPNMMWLDVNEATSIEFLYDDGFHMHRQGYHELAQAVRNLVAPVTPAGLSQALL
jgi:FkbH-like protein